MEKQIWGLSTALPVPYNRRGYIGASYNGNTLVSKTNYAGSIPAAPAKIVFNYSLKSSKKQTKTT